MKFASVTYRLVSSRRIRQQDEEHAQPKHGSVELNLGSSSAPFLKVARFFTFVALGAIFRLKCAQKSTTDFDAVRPLTTSGLA